VSVAASSGRTVIIVGASTRAAAFSALRAGLAPYCLDLFADADLTARLPCQRLAASDYPHRLADYLADLPPAPWLYTGALENHPDLIARIAQTRPLWGIGPPTLACVRQPWLLAERLGHAGIAFPPTYSTPDQLDPHRRWLQKPLASAGGLNIRFWDGQRPPNPQQWAWQEYIAGQPLSLFFVGLPEAPPLFLGATHMLVGLPDLAAGPFRYCGSIGPIPLDPPRYAQALHIGQTLAAIPGMLGLFGVDCIDHDGQLVVVEVNPRITAAAEVLEYAQPISTLALHARAFGVELPGATHALDRNHLATHALDRNHLAIGAHDRTGPPRRDDDPPVVVGKAILVARDRFRFPASGPWTEALARTADPFSRPDYADIPHPGTIIERGWPILTVLASGSSVAACQAQLLAQAHALERWFGSESSV
jgi:predicted ATP-grasp superfamily ATP-dependent carboligase